MRLVVEDMGLNLFGRVRRMISVVLYVGMRPAGFSSGAVDGEVGFGAEGAL
jgi:hypothetical protein